MAQTNIRGTQILNNTVQRHDIDVSTSGQALATKIVAGANISLSSTGVDAGTGDVTVTAPDVATLLSNVATLQSQVATLQSQVATLQGYYLWTYPGGST